MNIKPLTTCLCIAALIMACSKDKPTEPVSAPKAAKAQPAQDKTATAPTQPKAAPGGPTSASAIFHGSWWCVEPIAKMPTKGVAGMSVCPTDAKHDEAKAGHGPITIIKVDGSWCVRGEGQNGGRGLNGRDGHRGLSGCDSGAQPDPEKHASDFCCAECEAMTCKKCKERKAGENCSEHDFSASLQCGARLKLGTSTDGVIDTVKCTP